MTFFIRAIALCEKKFSGQVDDVRQLETSSDHLFIVSMNAEIISYLETMKTIGSTLFPISIYLS